MNTLKISKGCDVSLFVDDKPLFFVTDFTAHQISDSYSVKEMLCEEAVDEIILNKKYKIELTAFSHLDPRIFSGDKFRLSVKFPDSVYEYHGCTLKDHTREVKSDKPVVDKYTIVASQLLVLEA